MKTVFEIVKANGEFRCNGWRAENWPHIVRLVADDAKRTPGAVSLVYNGETLAESYGGILDYIDSL